jgi:hypothetical protein
MSLNAESRRSTKSPGKLRVADNPEHVPRHALDIVLADEEARFCT